MKLKDYPIVKRLFGVNCPLVAFWFPWYWSNSDTTILRKVAGRWLWQIEPGLKQRFILVVKTILWPLVALASIILSTFTHGKVARNISGRSRFSMFLEQLYFTLWRGFPPIAYYVQRIYLHELFAVVDDFIPGYQISLLNLAMSAGKDAEILNNKLRFGRECVKLGLPAIPIVGVFENGKMTEPDEISSLLRTDLYFKPVNGLRGGGIERWNYNKDKDTWNFGDKVKDEAALKSHFQKLSEKETYILQEAAVNHENLESFSAGGLTTFRVVTILGEGREPKVLICYLVTPFGKTVTNHNLYGGIWVQLNLETERFDHAFRGLPELQKLTHHPETGARLEGRQFTDWPKLKALALRAHKCFPEIFTIGWDLALTGNGPEIVEGNSQWGSNPGDFAGKTGYASLYLETLYKAKKNGDALGDLLK